MMLQSEREVAAGACEGAEVSVGPRVRLFERGCRPLGLRGVEVAVGCVRHPPVQGRLPPSGAAQQPGPSAVDLVREGRVAGIARQGVGAVEEIEPHLLQGADRAVGEGSCRHPERVVARPRACDALEGAPARTLTEHLLGLSVDPGLRLGQGQLERGFGDELVDSMRRRLTSK